MPLRPEVVTQEYSAGFSRGMDTREEVGDVDLRTLECVLETKRIDNEQHVVEIQLGDHRCVLSPRISTF